MACCDLQMEALGSQQATLQREIQELRREAARLNTPSTYAKCAKAQRMANAKEKELAALQAQGQPSWQQRAVGYMGYAKVRAHGKGLVCLGGMRGA